MKITFFVFIMSYSFDLRLVSVMLIFYIIQIYYYPINPNLGGLFRGSLRGGGWGEETTHPCLKLVRIMLEMPNVKLAFFVQNNTFTQSNSVRAVLQII